MFIERQDQLRSYSSFRSATNRLSPINGLSAIGGLKLFYKHCIPTEFPPSDSLSEAANDMRVSEVFSYIPAEDADRWRVALASLCQGAIVLSVLLLATAVVPAQTRDHLTDAETDLVRYYQELDKRVDIFIKAADRRWAVINGTAQPSTKKAVKDEPDWGDVPKGTRVELLGDIAGILDEAITNLDDVSRRDEKSPLLSRSLRKLTAASSRYLTQLEVLKTQTKNDDELAAIERVADDANQIIEAGKKLPAASADEGQKKKKP